MAYFSNGAEGMDYEEHYCSRCVHKDTCPIMVAHQLYNYDHCNDEGSILHLLIPRSEDGIGNEQCRMFYEKT